MITRQVLPKETDLLLRLEEDHFNDIKSKDINPNKLQETFVAFANADGGELWLGIEDRKVATNRLNGFKNKEDANDHLHTLLEKTNPSVENVDLEYVDLGVNGFLLHITIPKSTKVHYCANGDCFLRSC